MKHPRLIVGLLVAGSLASGLGTEETTYAGLDVESIEKAIGKSGDLRALF